MGDVHGWGGAPGVTREQSFERLGDTSFELVDFDFRLQLLKCIMTSRFCFCFLRLHYESSEGRSEKCKRVDGLASHKKSNVQ